MSNEKNTPVEWTPAAPAEAAPKPKAKRAPRAKKPAPAKAESNAKAEAAPAEDTAKPAAKAPAKKRTRTAKKPVNATEKAAKTAKKPAKKVEKPADAPAEKGTDAVVAESAEKAADAAAAVPATPVAEVTGESAPADEGKTAAEAVPAETVAAETAPLEAAPTEEEAPVEKAADAAPVEPAKPEETAPEKAPEAAHAPVDATVDGPATANAETPADETETIPADNETPADSTPTDEVSFTDGDDDVELPPIDEKRLLDMTRTVQLSVEQIMANMDDEPAHAAPDDHTDAPAHTDDTENEDDDTPDTVGDVMRSGVTGMAKWLLLVVFFVLVVAGFGVAYLYRSATPDMLPNIRVTFAGQTLEPSAYKWHVPVVGNWFKRTYAETYSSVPTVLETPVSSLSPDLTISSTDYATKLTVTDMDKETVFEGTLSEFSSYCFTETGTYTAKLVASATASRAAGAADITGSETWLFTFDISIEPSVYLSENTVQQGRVATIRVTGSYEDTAPTLTTTLDNQGFIQSSNGWVCYLPIPWNAPLGTETIDVQVGRYSTTLYLKVTDGDFAYKDYSSQSQRATPYIGQNDAPAKVSKLFTAAPNAISWADAGFVQPFLNRITTKLTFGATEYVGRTYSERNSNTGAGGRTSTNVILSTTRGELVIAPASGKVDLAEDLGGDYGYTLVLDHGAGVRTIFYNLDDIEVKAGQQIKQGQTLATCGKTTVVEMRVGTTPIDPIAVWRGQCNGLKYY